MLLEITNLSKNYLSPDGEVTIPILKNISLNADKGESIAIVGPSGSGKSTLLNLIGTLDKPSSGTVLLNGQDVTAVTDVEVATIRNRQIGFVFQQHHLLPQCTVLENVLMPTLPQKSSAGATERAKQLLDRVGLSQRLDHRPGQLSGGECQRAAVVRALINQPLLVLADEPTGALDARTSCELSQLLVDVNKELETTLIVVTHSTELAARMSQQYELLDGKLLPNLNKPKP